MKLGAVVSALNAIHEPMKKAQSFAFGELRLTYIMKLTIDDQSHSYNIYERKISVESRQKE